MQSIKVVNDVPEQQKQKVLQMMELLENSSRPEELCLQLFSVKERKMFRFAYDSLPTRLMEVIERKYQQLQSINVKEFNKYLQERSRYLFKRYQLKKQIDRGYYVNNYRQQLIDDAKKSLLILSVFTISVMWIYFTLVKIVLLLQSKTIKLCDIHEPFVWFAQQIRYQQLTINQRFFLELTEKCISKQVNINENQLNLSQFDLLITSVLASFIAFAILIAFQFMIQRSNQVANFFIKKHSLDIRVHNHYGPLNLVFSSDCIVLDSIYQREVHYYYY